MSDPISISLVKKVIAVTTQGRGLRGYGVEIDISDEGMIQWRSLYTGAPWNDIVDIADLKGDKGDNSYVHIKWHAEGSEVLLDTPEVYIGIYADNTEADSEVFADYAWYLYKGIQGNAAPNTIWQYSVDGTTWTDVATGAQWYKQSGDNGTTWSEAIAIGTTAYADGKITQTITEDVTTTAPSEGAVFDALALKAPLASPTFTGDVIVPDQTAGNNSTKAANTKYVDAGLGLKADVDDVTASLALKADITALNTEKQLLTQEIDALKKASIENSNAPYLTVSDYGDVALAKNSVGMGTVSVDGVTVENLVVNGDFDEGGPTLSSQFYTLSRENGTLKATVNALSTDARVGLPSMTLLTGNVYLLQVKFKPKYNNMLSLSIFGYGMQLYIGGLIANDWNMPTKKFTSDQTRTASVYLYHSTKTQYSIGDVVYWDEIKIIDLTALGLASLTETQLAKLLPTYFDSKKTFGGVGCLMSKDSTEAETGRMYFSTTPMYSNATLKDVLVYNGGKYYHTHNVDSDGVAIAEPYDTEVETNGQIVCLSEGTVEYQPYFPDIAVYTDKFTLTKAITAVKELYKYGSETPITDAVIAVDGLSFTSASLTAGDLAYGVFEFAEPLRPLMTIRSRNDDATIADTANGKVYTFRPVITNGAIASWTVTEV